MGREFFRTVASAVLKTRQQLKSREAKRKGRAEGRAQMKALWQERAQQERIPLGAGGEKASPSFWYRDKITWGHTLV